MFITSNLDKFHNQLKEKKVIVGEIVQMSNERVFNFADNEQNYFAVKEEK